MNFIELQEEYKTCILSIDREHEIMAGLVNSIYDAMDKNVKSVLLPKLNILLGSVEGHFANEEKLMTKNKFPGYYSHKLEHDRFYNQISTKVREYERDDTPIGIDDLKGIRHWFFNHIEIKDKKLCAFLTEKGIS